MLQKEQLKDQFKLFQNYLNYRKEKNIEKLRILLLIYSKVNIFFLIFIIYKSNFIWKKISECKFITIWMNIFHILI